MTVYPGFRSIPQKLAGAQPWLAGGLSTRALFLAAGAVWGIILGGLIGSAAAVFVFGADAPASVGGGSWPQGARWARPAFAALAGLLAVALCVAAGGYYAARTGASAAGRRRARRTGYGLLGLGAVTFAGMVAISLLGAERQVAGYDRGDARDTAFARLSADRHTIDRIEFFGWNADSGSAGIVTRGKRTGVYQILWQVTDPTSGQVLAKGRETASLGPGRRTVVIDFKRSALIGAYRDKVLTGAGGVVAATAFRLTATVEPALSPADRAALPPRAIENLATGQSPLRSEAGVDLPVSFRLPVVPSFQTG